MSIAAPVAPLARRTLPVANPGLAVRRMSFEDFMRLPEKPKAEWLEGWAVIHVAPVAEPHGEFHYRLSGLLYNALPTLVGINDGPLRIGNKLFFPDISLQDASVPSSAMVSRPPILVVEILSPNTRKYDLTFKAAEYLAAGVIQYWTVDTKSGEIVVRENANTEWQTIATLDKEHPTTEIPVSEYGTVKLDRALLFPN